MDSTTELAAKLDSLISSSRLHQIAVIMGSERQARLAKMVAALNRLPRGAYLLGTGPSTVGIVPLSVEEIVLGRTATTGEEPSATVIDYAVNDSLYFAPKEVSRAHAKIVRRTDSGGTSYGVVDLGSSCGTFVNGKQVRQEEGRLPLKHGDVLSLGPLHISTYLFCIVDES